MGTKGTNTYTTQSGPPAWLSSAYQGMIPQVQAAAGTPFTPYPGQMVAPVNPEQLGGIGQVNEFSTAAQPWLTTAGMMTAQAGQPISPNDISRYYNPYVATVGGATLEEMNALNAAQQQSVIGNAVSSGAWGGDRSAIAQSELAGQQARAELPTLAGINQAAYQQAIQTGLSEQQAQLAAAYGMGNIGQAIQQTGLGGAGAMLQAGGLQQATQQQMDTAAFQQFLAQQGYPFQSLGWEASILGGLGSQAGGTSQTTAPAPNPLNTILGIGATAAGAYMGMPAHKRGGGIHIPRGYQDGGMPMMPYSGGRSYVPSFSMATRGSGPPRPPVDPSYMVMRDALGGQGGGSSGYGNIGGAIGRYLGRSPGIDTSGAGAGFPLEGSADANSLDFVVPMTDEGRALGGVSTGGGVLPEHAGLGFAGLRGYQDGGDPDYAMSYAPKGDSLRIPGPYEDPSVFNPIDAAPPPLPAKPPNYDREVSAARAAAAKAGTPGIDALIGPKEVDATDLPPLDEKLMGRGQKYPGSWEGPGTPLTPDVVAANKAIANVSGRGQPPSPYTPTGLNPQGGVGSSRYPATPLDYSQLATRPEDTRSFMQKMSLPLMQAGFAMMASRSPFLGEAIGQGGLAGIGAYLGQEKEKRGAEEKQEELGLRARQLSDVAQQHRETLAASQQRWEAEMREKEVTPHAIGTDMFGKNIYGIYDRQRGTYVDPLTRQPIDMTKIQAGREGNMQSISHAIAGYQLPPMSPAKLTTPEGQAIQAAVLTENPNYRAEFYNEANRATTAFGTGPQGNSVRAFSTGISHLDILDEAADNLAGGNISAVRRLVQATQREMGWSSAPTTFDAIKPIVAAEITKAIVGNVAGVTDREETQRGIERELATSSIKDVINKYKDLMGGQLVNFQRQFATSTHMPEDQAAKVFEGKLSPSAIDMLHNARQAEEARRAKTQPAATAPAATTPAATTPAPLPPKDKLVPGTYYPGYGTWSGTGFRRSDTAPATGGYAS